MEKQEEEVFSANLTCSTYSKFIFLPKINYLLFPLTVLLFVVDEGLQAVYFRFISGYDALLEGEDSVFEGDDRLFWGVLGGFLFLYFLLYTMKYFLLSLCILNSTEQLHEEMLEKLVRSPCSFFDVVSTGELANKFSNDLGILDQSLCIIVFEVFEGLLYFFIAFANMFAIDVYFIIPGSIHMLFVVLLFLFSKKTIMLLREIDLKSKSPVFNMVNEMLMSLTQIRIFSRRLSLLR